MTIRVHIDGRALEPESPLSGKDLYRAAHLSKDEVLYREVAGGREDEVVPEDAESITLEPNEHFYSADRHKVSYQIIVNARPKDVDGRKISFDAVVRLGFPGGPPTPQTVYTVTYSEGPPRNPEGKMVAGQQVKIRDGMIFDVTETNRS